MYLTINYFLFQESTPCKILVEIDNKRYEAAIGRIIPTGLAEYMHGSPVLLDEVRVTPDEVKDGFQHICVPFPPPNGPEWLGELVGFFIKWPIHLIELCEVFFYLSL
jgi:hypothetical protein